MKTLLLLIPFFCFFSFNLSAQTLNAQIVSLGENAYVIFARDSVHELYSQYFSLKDGEEVQVSKIQYLYNPSEQVLWARVSIWEVPASDFPEDFTKYRCPESNYRNTFTKTFLGVPKDFKLLRGMVYTRLGLTLEECKKKKRRK